ncbi:MAG: PilZ domain-containing protein [Syntrophobacterales bacterium]|nr:MAG: PilZ domain-containing protein [Syntrophobacterales bacterium]
MEEGKFAQSKPPHPKIGFAERRKYPRFECELPIDCITSESEMHVGIVANISQGGILVCLHDQIKVGTPLRIQLVFAQGFQLKTIGANAVVVWRNIVHHAFWGRYRYGLRLIGISERVFWDFKGLLGQLAREFHLRNVLSSS